MDLTKWVADADNVREVLSEVSDTLAAILNDQRQKLDQVDAKRSGPERYEMARKAGCFAAIAKGAKHRTLKPEQIFIPRSEFKVVNGQLRIPVLKATLAIPSSAPHMGANTVVKAVIFRLVPAGYVSGEATRWESILEVVEQKQLAAAA
jgi:hypothetical protein